MPLYFNGTPINKVVFNGQPLSQAYMNTVQVFSSGATVGLFCGSWLGGATLLSRLDYRGTRIGGEKSLGLNGFGHAGATANSVGIFAKFAIYHQSNFYFWDVDNKYCRVNISGELVGTETSIGTKRNYVASAPVGDFALFYGGTTKSNDAYILSFPMSYDDTFNTTRTTTRINDSGGSAGSETTLGTKRTYQVGSSASGKSIGLFYGGDLLTADYQNNLSYRDGLSKTVTRIDANGLQYGSEVKISDGITDGAGTEIGNNATYYGTRHYLSNYAGNNTLGSQEYTDRVISINGDGNISGSITHIPAVIKRRSAASIGGYGVYTGSLQGVASEYRCVIIDSNGSQVGSTITISDDFYLYGSAAEL